MGKWFLKVCTCVFIHIYIVRGKHNDFDGCNIMVYNDYGMFSAKDTLLECAAQMASPMTPISYDINYKGNLTVRNQLGINNLIEVDEVSSVIEIDFYYRNNWVDTRWKMNESFWTELRPDLGTLGMEIYFLVKNNYQEDNLPFWTPDGWFQDQLGWEEHAHSLKLYPDGSIFYSRHCTLTLKQSHLDLSKYPLDIQYIDLKLMSYGYSAEQVRMIWEDPPISYLEDEDGNVIFSKHPIWGHTVGYYRASHYSTPYNINGHEVSYETNHLQIRLDRLGAGVFTRFALPILILVILAGLTFWANAESRIDTTMTILLSVSALYVVILESIPQVGYLTDFDTWIFTNFVMLSICVFFHQVVVNSMRKVSKWPFRAVIIRLIELVGRIVVIPLAVVNFSQIFNTDDFRAVAEIMTIIFFVIFSLVCIREIFGVRKSIKNAIKCIRQKIDKGESKCSWIELFALNLYLFQVIDFTTIPYEAKKKRLERMKAENEAQLSNGMSSKVKRSRNNSLIGRVMRSYSMYDSDDDDDAL